MQLAMVHLGESDSAFEAPDADHLAYLMNSAIARDIVEAGFVDFVRSAVDAITRLGVGEDFTRSTELAEAMHAAAVALDQRGLPTTDVHLARATYFATLSNGGADRRKAIEAAIEAAQTVDEYLRARTTLAKFSIDMSDYSTAQQIADDCDRLARSSEPVDNALLAEARVTRGLSFFYRGDSRAQAAFQGVLDLADHSTPTPSLQRAVAEAHHFIGRLHALSGDYEPALSELVEAQRLSAGSGVQQRKSRAYFHLRLAEILLAAGSRDEAEYHVVEAEQLLRVVRDASAADAQLEITVARLELARGDWRRAEKLLRPAVEVMVRDNHVRGALLGMAQLVRVHVAGRQYGRAAAVALRGARLWWSDESARTATGPARAPRWRSARVAVTTARRAIVWRSKPTPREPVHCPCGGNHTLA